MSPAGRPAPLRIGTAEIVPVIEQAVLAFPLAHMQAGVAPADVAAYLDWLAPTFYDPAAETVLLSHHSWVVKSRAGIVLIDPCVGNGKHRPLLPFYDDLDTPWLERLAAAEVTPEAVDFVLCTHLHVDHCGWNTQREDGRWVPTFPNARYLFSRVEHDFWVQDLTGTLPRRYAFNRGVFADSVMPVIEAGQAMIVDRTEDFAFATDFRLIDTPGHTPGHVAAIFESDGDGALFCGDALHWPAQIVHPDWRAQGSFDDDQAIDSRRRLLGLCVDHGYFLAPAHFGPPYGCRVARTDAGDFSPIWPSAHKMS